MHNYARRIYEDFLQKNARYVKVQSGVREERSIPMLKDVPIARGSLLCVLVL